MRKDGIPYVPNPVSYKPPKNYMDMDLQELKRNYIKTCAKSNNSLATCSQCLNPCEYGKRAIELLAGNITLDTVPLYDGKTLIERAKEENMKRKKEMEIKEDTKDWWGKSLMSEDQLGWVMKEFGLTKLKAQRKIYSYRYTHGLTDKTYKTKKAEKAVQVNSLEAKLEDLMKIQQQYEKEMEHHLKMYEATKKKNEEIKSKIDILCSAADILNGAWDTHVEQVENDMD